MRRKRRLVGLLGVLAVFAAGTPVFAGPTYSFFDITDPGSANAAIGEAQLFMEVLDVPPAPGGPAQVQFRFFNTGPLACSICDVCFDDGALLGISDIINGPGVSFDKPATPVDLPGRNNVTPHFQTTDQFSADSNPPVSANGVDQPGETLGIVFSLKSGGTYANILDELASGEIRVGLHVQAFPTGDSQSFINHPNPIPVPGAALLSILGIGLVGQLRCRRLLGK
jgi:hypothetical protein